MKTKKSMCNELYFIKGSENLKSHLRLFIDIVSKIILSGARKIKLFSCKLLILFLNIITVVIQVLFMLYNVFMLIVKLINNTLC